MPVAHFPIDTWPRPENSVMHSSIDSRRRLARALLGAAVALTLALPAHAERPGATPGVPPGQTLPPPAQGNPPPWAGGPFFRQGVVSVANPYGAQAGARHPRRGWQRDRRGGRGRLCAQRRRTAIGGHRRWRVHDDPPRQDRRDLRHRLARARAGRREAATCSLRPGLHAGLHVRHRGGRARAWCAAPRWQSTSGAVCHSRRCSRRRSSWPTRASRPRRGS